MPCRCPFGMGEENDNSEKLLSFCVSHDLLIGGTWFRHRLVHRYTFNPPDQQMRKKMLDHILFGSTHRSCLHNVRTRRGKITLTDHEMVIAKMRKVCWAREKPHLSEVHQEIRSCERSRNSRVTILRQRKGWNFSHFLLQCPRSRWSGVRKCRSFQVSRFFRELATW